MKLDSALQHGAAVVNYNSCARASAWHRIRESMALPLKVVCRYSFGKRVYCAHNSSYFTSLWGILLLLAIITAVLRIPIAIGMPLGFASDANVADKVHFLTEASFDSFIASEPSVFMFFYASWCFWCRQLFPQFNEAARLVESQSLPIKLAALDAARYTDVGERYHVTAYPTLILFLDGEPHPYTGLYRTGREIMKWITIHLNTELTVKNIEQFEAFYSTHLKVPLLLARLIPNTSAYRSAYIAASRQMDNAGFLETDNVTVLQHVLDKHQGLKDVSKHLLATPETIILIKPSADQLGNREPALVQFVGDMSNSSSILEFAKTYAFPSVIHLDEDVMPTILARRLPLWVLFNPSGSPTTRSEAAYDATYALAKEFRNRFTFAYCDGSLPLHKRLGDLLGVEGHHPAVRLLRMHVDERQRSRLESQYRPPAESVKAWHQPSLRTFLEAFEKGEVKPFRKSEPPPDPAFNQGPVYTLVADEFDTHVYDSPYDVLLEVYAPWCGHCRQLEKTYREVATVLKPLEHLRVMKLDGTLNEINLFIAGYPTLVFFTRSGAADVAGQESHKKKRVIYFDGARTTDSILEFVAKHTSKPFNVQQYRNQYSGESGAANKNPGQILTDEL